MDKRLPAAYRWENYRMGTPVRHRETMDMGHIVGFDRVYYDHGFETIIKVLWEDGVARAIHPLNVETFN